MLTSRDVVTVEARSCGECGRLHRFRIATLEDDAAPVRPWCGFFESCPVTQRRSWYVIALRSPTGRPARLLEVGPPDDQAWFPGEESNPSWAQRRSKEWSEAAPLGPLSPVPSRGNETGGFRVPSQSPDVLRRALGCPHSK